MTVMGPGLPPYSVSQEVAPCVLHLHHSPITVVNELHHPFPQFLQRRVWGEVRDDRLVSVCSTGHNSVHNAINHFLKTGGPWPGWCVGKTRDLAQRAILLYQEARGDSVATTPEQHQGNNTHGSA